MGSFRHRRRAAGGTFRHFQAAISVLRWLRLGSFRGTAMLADVVGLARAAHRSDRPPWGISGNSGEPLVRVVVVHDPPPFGADAEVAPSISPGALRFRHANRAARRIARSSIA